MKTLHIDSGRAMGGGQWQVIYLLDGLRDAALLARRDSPLFQEAARRGIDVHPLGVAALTRLMREADLIHAHDARAHALAVAANRPIVASRRVGFPVSNSAISRWKYRRAAHYIAVSNFVAGKLPVSDDRITVVYDGVPIPPPRDPDPARRFSIAGLASKGGDFFRREGIPVHFCHNLQQDLSAAGVFVYWSEMEGLGSALLVAMASGVPVVASAVGGVPEAVEHEVTGLLCENSGAAFKDALHRLENDREFARRLGLCARERAIERFSDQAMRAATLRVYEKVLS